MTIENPEASDVIATRSEILQLLLEIDAIAKEMPHRNYSIRNRTRESITRQLHYQRDLERLRRMREDAAKLLALWQNAN